VWLCNCPRGKKLAEEWAHDKMDVNVKMKGEDARQVLYRQAGSGARFATCTSRVQIIAAPLLATRRSFYV